MFKRVLSILLASSLVLSTGIMTVSATEQEETKNEKIEIKTITPVIKNNITTYYDQDGNEVDITENNRKIDVDESKLPSSYDLRDEGRATSVKNQGTEGFCWSFASTSSLESNILSNPELRAELGENPEQKLDLSEVGNSWYVHTSINDEDSDLYNDYFNDVNKGSQGGNDIRVAMGLSSGFGTYPEELLPYSEWGNRFPESLRFYSDYRLKEFNQLENDVPFIKQRLIDNGTVYVSYKSFDSNYNYTDEWTSYYDNGQSISEELKMSGHAVSIVGWDDNFSRENFKEEMRPENDGAWLIKNSWGEDWGSKIEGYKGYFWMSYETQVNSFSQFTVQSVEEFDNIYQHQFTTDESMEVKSAANVFTAEKDEVLEQICFANYGSADFTVEVYKLDDNFTSPIEGELLTSFEDSVDFTGTHCIEVPNKVILNSGDTFSVVIKCDNYISINRKYRDDTLPNKSYCVFDDGNWLDNADESSGYLSIKAMTSNKDGAVYKDELSQLVDTVENMAIRDDVPQKNKDEIGYQLNNAKSVLNDGTATQNTVDNTYCLLSSAVEVLDYLFYDINSIEDFIKLHKESLNCAYTDAIIQLNTDLDFSSYEEMKPLFSSTEFRGIFYGNDHTISNLKIASENAGLFSSISNAKISDLNLDNCTFIGESEAGAITCIAPNSSVVNCTVSNSKIIGKNIRAGGIISNQNEGLLIKDCEVSQSEIIGKNMAGIFVSCMESIDEFDNCVSKEAVAKSTRRIMNNKGSLLSCLVNSDGAVVFLVATDDKYSVEPLFGEITGVKSEEAVVTKNGEKYDVDMGDNAYSYVDVFCEDIDSKNFEYEFDYINKDIKLTSYVENENATETNIVFPEYIENIPVTSISSNFGIQSNVPVKSMTFAGNIKNINMKKFHNMIHLETLTFGEGVEVIDEYVFSECTSLKTINLPDSLETIAEGAFYNCNLLEEVNFGKNLKTIKMGAFSGCKSLSSIVLSDNLESVGSDAFSGCSSLSVVLGKNIKDIGEYSFGYTRVLTQDYKEAAIPEFTVVGYKNTPAEEYANINGFKFVDITSENPEIPQGSFDYSVFKKGDVNLDGQVTIADATLIQKYLAEREELSDIQKSNAIIFSYNPSITIENATYIQKSLVGLVTL